MNLGDRMLQVQQDPAQHTVSCSEPIANPQGETSTATASAGKSFMRCVRIPSQAQKSPVNHQTLMTEFKIDYQVRKDKKGLKSVHKVYLPSTWKGWAIMAEKKDAASPCGAELPREISVGHLHLTR